MRLRLKQALVALTLSGVLVGGAAAIASAQSSSPSPSSSSSSSTTDSAANCPNM
jgi:hypothetical protein